MSLIHACFSCIVGATKWRVTGVPHFCSTTILKSRLACSTWKALAWPELLLVAAELSLTPLLCDENDETDDSVGRSK